MFVFVHVSLVNHTPEDTKDFLKNLKEWKEVRACYMLAGETDYLLQVIAKDWSDLQDFMTQKLLTVPNVAKVKSYPTLRCNFFRPGVPLEEEE
jgi:DNA-binding Lrp family transcriptional regulator